ncbi:TOBE domain-containing protein [Hydrogenimonas sp.]
MNRLAGVVEEVYGSGGLTLVRIACEGALVSAYLLEEGSSARFGVGRPVWVLFKESETALAKGPLGSISLRNRFEGAVTEVRKGELLAEVTVDLGGTPVVSIVSRSACDEMAIGIGDRLTLLIKANEITLMERNDG